MNPIGGVDIAAIEAAMKQSSLDHLKGYSQNQYGTVEQSEDTEYVNEDSAKGYQVLREPAWNKGEISTGGFMRIHSNLLQVPPLLPKKESTRTLRVSSLMS